FDQQSLECLLFGNGSPYTCCSSCGGWSPPTCMQWENFFASWSTDARANSVPGEQACELILNFRTVRPANRQHDYLAPSAGDWTYPEVPRERTESNLRRFGYRFANCIDGFQAGNEVYSGPGRYYFEPGDVPGDCDGVIRTLPAECVRPATAAMLAQLGAQLEAARFGSGIGR